MGGRVRSVNDIEILQEMLVSASQVPLQKVSGKPPSVILTDVQAEATVTIKGLPQDSIVLRAEVFVPCADLDNSNCEFIFEGFKGECKRADFVILSTGAKKWIIFIEIQKGNYKSYKEVVQQLKGALCFMNYCKCIGKEFWLEEEFLDSYECRFVSMKDISLDKRKTRPGEPKQPLHSTPEDFLRIFGNSHHFRSLIYRGS